MLTSGTMAAGSGSTSGGSGGSTGSGSSSPPAAFTSVTGIDIQTFGPVGIPNAASYDTSVAPQLATAGGPSFDASSGSYPLNGASFPLLLTALGWLNMPLNGLHAVTINGGDTFTINTTSSTRTTWTLNLRDGESLGGGGIIPGDLTRTPNSSGDHISALSYVALGEWSQTNTSGSVGGLQSVYAFVFGYETPAANIPTSGQATFTGIADASVFLPMPDQSNQSIQRVYVNGTASMSVNFTSGNVSGTFTNMQYTVPNNSTPLPWNDVSVSAAIASGTNRFSGTAAVTTSPANSFSLKPSAAGTVNGGLYGPAAQNLGAVWTLNDGNASVLGAVIAH